MRALRSAVLHILLCMAAALAAFSALAQTLSASPSSVIAGQSVTATWSGISGPTAQDWIGIFAPGATNNAFIAWSYTNGNDSGNLSLGVPVNLATGTYEVRLFTNNSFTLLATSGSISVTAAPPASLSAAPSSVTAGQPVTATWSGIVAPAAQDWIGLFAPGAANNAFVAWTYTSGSAAGNLSFGIPVNLATGAYELRLFTDNSFTLLATSNSLSVSAVPPAALSTSPGSVNPGDSVTAAWTGIVNSSAADWIGLYTPGAADNAFLAWTYTTGAAAGNIPFTIPSGTPLGTYQLRLYTNNSFTRLATSPNLSVGIVKLSFIHPDHVNTPRQVYDDQSQLRWRWAQAEPFGLNAPNEDPSSLGTVDVPLRFPGQFADKETGLNQNYFRDYNSSIGRYAQSDPIGLRGGLNTYAYVDSTPVSRVDPNGLYWFQQAWQAADPIVGRERTIVPPGGPISSFVERYVPAGRTMAEIHDPLVDALTRAGIPDAIVNIPTMPLAYFLAYQLEWLRMFGVVKQPAPICRP